MKMARSIYSSLTAKRNIQHNDYRIATSTKPLPPINEMGMEFLIVNEIKHQIFQMRQNGTKIIELQAENVCVNGFYEC